ncbi:hypothetical protein EPO66_05600 [bacterium]|nr:MAG: hypothetical protein EPO66_05600 [bacterium]
MIKIDFYLAVALYSMVFLGAIFVLWLLDKDIRKKDIFVDPKFIWFCNICTYTYINSTGAAISVCPRCGNYNKKSVDTNS